MGTKKLVFAISLASTVALVAGLFVASEVRACALENEAELPLDISDVVEGSTDLSSTQDVQAFDGEWVFAGSQRERDGIDAAIATSMDALSPLVRGLGTRRLKESNPVPARVSISVAGDSARIGIDGDGHDAKLDGTPVKSKSSEGYKIKVSHKVKGAKLVQFLDGVGGDRTNYFSLNADASRLTVKVKITSGQLPVPVEYRLTFKRR